MDDMQLKRLYSRHSAGELDSALEKDLLALFGAPAADADGREAALDRVLDSFEASELARLVAELRPDAQVLSRSVSRLDTASVHRRSSRLFKGVAALAASAAGIALLFGLSGPDRNVPASPAVTTIEAAPDSLVISSISFEKTPLQAASAHEGRIFSGNFDS